MKNFEKVNFGKSLFWLLGSLSVLFFGLNWFFVFQLFYSDFSAGILFFILALAGGNIFILPILFLEKKRSFSLLVFCLGNIAPFLFFSLLNKASFLGLAISIFLATLLFLNGKKHFWKETSNQIKIQPTVSLKKPFKGLVLALAILFSFSFYSVNFFQEAYSQSERPKEEKVFVVALENVAFVWEKVFPKEQSVGGFDLNLTIDEYIKQNLPPQDRSLLGSQVQLPDGTVAVFTQELLDELDKTGLEKAREQLSGQFEQSLNGNEKLFQVIGMILDQRLTGVADTLKESWPTLSPILFVKALSAFFVFIWLGNLLRWPVSKLAEGLLWSLVKKGLIKKEIRLVEKEDFSLE